MKTLFGICLLVVGMAVTANAQNAQDKTKSKLDEKNVPQAVKSAFTSAYANASDIEWKAKNGNYKVKFEQDGKDQIAELSASGEIISKGVEIEKSELPSAVSDAIASKNANAKIDKLYRIEKGGQTHYMVKMDGSPEKKVMYSEDGKIMKE